MLKRTDAGSIGMFFMWRMKKNKTEGGDGRLSALDDLPVPGDPPPQHRPPCPGDRWPSS